MSVLVFDRHKKDYSNGRGDNVRLSEHLAYIRRESGTPEYTQEVTLREASRIDSEEPGRYAFIDADTYTPIKLKGKE